MEIKLYRSKRRTLALQIKNYNELIVKAPLKMKDEQIYAFIKQKEGWINKAMARLKVQSDFKNNFDFKNYIYLLGECYNFSDISLLNALPKTFHNVISSTAEKTLPNKKHSQMKKYIKNLQKIICLKKQKKSVSKLGLFI